MQDTDFFSEIYNFVFEKGIGKSPQNYHPYINYNRISELSIKNSRNKVKVVYRRYYNGKINIFIFTFKIKVYNTYHE